MRLCSFELNDNPMSAFCLGGLSFDAFSGSAPHVNRRESACLANAGPIPPGTYYIVDREAGGVLGTLWSRIKGRTDWFALYADDTRIDDVTYCNEVERGNFRPHPKGPYGISKGCIVIDRPDEFHHLRNLLRSLKPVPVRGGALNAYAKLVVR